MHRVYIHGEFLHSVICTFVFLSVDYLSRVIVPGSKQHKDI